MGKSSNLAYIDGVLMGCEWGFTGKTSNLTNKIQKNNTEWWNGLPESMIVEWDCHLVSRWKRNVATNQRYPQSSVVSLPKMPPLACCFFPFQPHFDWMFDVFYPLAIKDCLLEHLPCTSMVFSIDTHQHPICTEKV